MAYQHLLDILKESRDYREQYITTPPAACPDDGVVLDTGPGGELHCPWGHFVVLVNDRWVTRDRT